MKSEDAFQRDWERAAEQRLETMPPFYHWQPFQRFTEEVTGSAKGLQVAFGALYLSAWSDTSHRLHRKVKDSIAYFPFEKLEMDQDVFEELLLATHLGDFVVIDADLARTESIVSRLSASEPSRRREILERMVVFRLRSAGSHDKGSLTVLQAALGVSYLVVDPWQEEIEKGLRDEALSELFHHMVAYKGSQPGVKWWERARAIGEGVDRAAVLGRVDAALETMGRMALQVPTGLAEQVRGMVVVLALWPDADSSRVLARALRVCGEKIPGAGARCEKGFSGAVWALRRMGTFEALAAMSLARAKVRIPKLLKLLEAALTEAARDQGLTLEELEERVVPGLGLGRTGVLSEVLAGGSGELSLDERGRARLVWRSGDKVVSSPTQAMKAGSADELASLKRLKKELEGTVAAQKRRLDRMFLSRRRIPYAAWVERYLEHPVMRNLTKRLVWDFRTGDDTVLAMPRDWEVGEDGGFVEAGGRSVEVPEVGTTVSLWHPLDSALSERVSWRDAVFAWEVTQPVKQVFREVYVLTPAEERTRVYSNRYAAQIVRQHQAMALMRERGWSASVMGFFDADFPYPSRQLREWGLKAEFFVDIAGEEMTDAGIAVYLSTDQVRFLRDQVAVPLAEIPDVVFSEVFRDVDLFVGVAAVRNDPEWQDQGEREVFDQRYWYSSSFGELTAMAETRKDVLTRLLPRLKLGQVSRIEGRYLVVKGTRHEYKIHLGSGNILMSPDDRYLCIVPSGKDETADLYLPFEGDKTLAVILSKATLLAADDKIKDQTILQQL